MRFEAGLAFVDRCTHEPDLEKLINSFRESIRTFGFQSSAGGSWDGLGVQRTNRFFFLDWPEDVLKTYVEQGMEQRDPLIFAARRCIAPFVWDEVYSDPHLPPESKELYQFANNMGFVDGFCVPIHGPGGYQGLVSLLAREKLALTPQDRAILQMMCRAIHERCRTTIGFGLPLADLPKLTPREIECIRWVAVGKSDWEIGQILKIAEATAHFHIENAKKKLNKSTRTEAVAMLVLHGLI
jgi:LuxR family quorum sensing-dependent transcriptional regulator